MTCQLPTRHKYYKVGLHVSAALLCAFMTGLLLYAWLNFFNFGNLDVASANVKLFFEEELILTEDRITDNYSSRTRETDTAEVDYVTPIKIVPSYSADEQDTLLLTNDPNANYKPNNYSSYSSGLFRPKMAEIWDPHPEYQFEGFGMQFHLVLFHDSNFAKPNLKIVQMSRNDTNEDWPNIQTNGCFYSGYIKGRSPSNVVVSLCAGMTGHIYTERELYSIEPIESEANERNAQKPIAHLMRKIVPSDVEHCASLQFPNSHPPLVITSAESYKSDSMERNASNENVRLKRSAEIADLEEAKMVKRSGRRSRSPSAEYVVELLVVADRKMVEFHGQELHNYVLTLMSIVAKLYKDKSIGNPMHVAVVKFIALTEDIARPRSPDEGFSASEMLDDFCKWQKSFNDMNEDSPNHHDCALLLTREHICRSPDSQKCNNTLGLAQLGTMCQKNSCAIVRDNGLSAAFTIAHELGHVLSMPHDGEGKCNQLGDEEKGKKQRVMSRVLDQHTHPWSWSACSRHYLTEYLEAGYGDCLMDMPFDDIVKKSLKEEAQPGESYSKDKQCELLYGPGSKICSHMEVCQSLWCTKGSNELEGCRTHHMPWAEGTTCGERKWCQQGICVRRDRVSLQPINGGWGHWQPFGECSRRCGGGIQKSNRSCDNPSPSNGGKYCIGKRVRYQSCNTHECSENELDFRAQQCAKFNNKNFNIPNLPQDVKWIPKYGGRDNDRCKLYCRVAHASAYYQLMDKVVDGTACSLDTYDVCVNGVCQKAGCDHTLDSNKVLDTCGVCGGDNSTCKQVFGAHNSSTYGYNKVITIPAGASNIDIKQHGFKNSNKDDNYIALRDAVTGEYVLNGNFAVSMFRKIIVFGRTTFEYSGGDCVVERVNASRPLHKDLILELLAVGVLNPPDITYQYTIPRQAQVSSFIWNSSDMWTTCNKICQGTHEKIMRCLKKGSDDIVNEELCSDVPKPSPQKKPCNEHCRISWQMISESKCSSNCGDGYKSVKYQCAITQASNISFVSHYSCSHIKKPADKQSCVGPCDMGSWKYSQWKPCSASCGEGVQIRTAECVNELGKAVDETKCEGEKITMRACMEEACPRWLPDKWGPCSVSCGMGQREMSYRCLQEDREVDNSLCQQISPAPSVKESCSLKPCPTWITGSWSECSETCGRGTRTRTVTCSDGQNCLASNKPDESESCEISPCPEENEIPDNSDTKENDNFNYSWEIGQWSACSSTCDGYRRRSVGCYSKSHNKYIPSQDCHTSKPMPPKIEPCARKCVIWKTSEWDKCSASCGKGTSRRQVYCYSIKMGKKVEDEDCVGESLDKPSDESICDAHTPCLTTHAPIFKLNNYFNNFKWRIGAWGECSVTCGGGRKKRIVICQNEDGQEGPDSSCEGQKPETVSDCNSQFCANINSWKYGKWSKCNETCGRGFQYREVSCQNEFGLKIMDEHCDAKEKKNAVQECPNLKACVRYSYFWKASVWSDCSVSCGMGIQTRTLECHQIADADSKPLHDRVVQPKFCQKSAKPIVQQSCQRNPCTSEASPYSWVPGPWGDCSYPCGRKGRQKRTLYCYRQNGKRVARKKCKKLEKPARRKKCNQRPCGFTSCVEIKQRLNTTQDRDYIMNILGRNISIYCHNMRTRKPSEYLTLPSGGAENYSEFYEKRLSDPDVCPFGGERNSNCPCLSETSREAGVTIFQKVKINITNLHLFPDDFTFATVVKGRRINYGEAGDCYSQADCPQGRFNIDLSGTGLRVSPATRWITNGFMRINNLKDGRKVIGKCGGHCGICKPENGLLKLDILPP